MSKPDSLFIDALKYDNSLPIEPAAVSLWLRDVQNPLRWTVRPVLQFLLGILLHIVWFIKRLPLPQFSHHGLLQFLICWFCRHWVSVEANKLILRHYATESNILNFLADNSVDHSEGNTFGDLSADLSADSSTGSSTDSAAVHGDAVTETESSEVSEDTTGSPARIGLYPQTIDQMIIDSFVDHDQELFRMMKELGYWQPRSEPLDSSALSWQHWRPLNMEEFDITPRRTQVIDFETAHALFMCLFCLLLTRDQYRDAINGFNFDQSIAIRIGQLVGDNSFVEMAYNRYPMYLVGPWNLGQRFLMHGFFTEYAYAKLEALRLENH